MRILFVGASGTIGKKVADDLAQRHEVIRASRMGEIKVDITSLDSIREMYRQVGMVDAVASAAGGGYFGPFEKMTEADFYQGIRSKMMGQINLVMEGRAFVNPGGSFSLITGILADDPIRNGLGLSVVNGAVNAFALAAAIELKEGKRINVICPGMVEDAIDTYGPFFPGHPPISMEKVILAYRKSIEGFRTGEVIKIYK